LTAHVAKDDHRARHVALRVLDRCRAVVDRGLGAIFGDQQRVLRQLHGLVRAQRAIGRVLQRFARVRLDEPEYPIQRFAHGFRLTPARQALRHRVQKRDAAVGIGQDHRVPDAVECRQQQIV